MATLTATAAQSTVPAKYAVNGAISRVVSYAATAALSAGDIVQMARVPKGAVMQGVSYAWSLSAGAVTAIIGDGDNKSAYAAATVFSAAAIAVADSSVFAGFGRTYTVEDTVDVEVTAVSAAPGTAKLKMRLIYTLDN